MHVMQMHTVSWMPADRPITDMQLLVADDNRDGADALSALLRLEFGCRVVTAYDGEQALQLALAIRPDALILDLQMPGLTGFEVAGRAARSKDGSARPLILAMTGRRDLARDLAAMDLRFDRAFAKPLDHATLLATLRAHWLGGAKQRPPTPFRLFDTFTQAARDVMPLIAARRQQVSFDAEGPELTLHGDEPALHSAMYRLMCGAIELVGSGIVMFGARSDPFDEGHVLTVNLAGNGKLESAERAAQVLQRLGLVIDAGARETATDGETLRARAVCPNTSGHVRFTSHASEGILLRLVLSLRPVEVESPPQAVGARAWLIDGRGLAPALLERRLQRLGWRVWRFTSAIDASKHLSAAGLDDGPELLVVCDDPPVLRSSALALRHRLPSRTRCVLLVGVGAPGLRDPGALAGCEMRVEPLSPADLAEMTASAIDHRQFDPGPTTPSHGLGGRRKVLVVDDNEVNRVVATGLLRALGYEVASVADGLDAIEHCKQSPPDVVLMDIDMPVLGGIDATRRLVELQQIGRVAPFAIVAATADDSPETQARCLHAGMRGYLGKPLRFETIRDELRRVGVAATTRSRD